MATDDILTNEQLEEVTRWVQTHWPNQKCPWDGTDNWEIENRLARLPAGRPEGRVLHIFPLVALTCANCGYTTFVNALKIGIIPPQPVASDGKVE